MVHTVLHLDHEVIYEKQKSFIKILGKNYLWLKLFWNTKKTSLA